MVMGKITGRVEEIYFCKGSGFSRHFCNFVAKTQAMEKFSKEMRSRVMAAIHSKGTRPEMTVRRFLFAHGFRYRVNNPRLPGHPDIVLRKYRTCIFVNGCFWHGHACRYAHMPKTNTDFWEKKISRNKARDLREQKKLAEMGWHVIVVWECELKKDKKERTLGALLFTLNHILLQDTCRMYPTPDAMEGEGEKAAEAPAAYGKRGAVSEDTP